jgi:hypothetical protein
MPLPLDVAGLVMVTHLTLLDALQVALACGRVSVVFPGPPIAVKDAEGGFKTGTVETAPACITVSVWPAIESEPVRLEVVVLAATVTVTYPFPLPEAVWRINQFKVLEDDQEQPFGAVTATVNPPPAAMVDMLVGLIE